MRPGVPCQQLWLLLPLLIGSTEALFCPIGTPYGCLFFIFGYTMRRGVPFTDDCVETCAFFPPLYTVLDNFQCGTCMDETPAPTTPPSPVATGVPLGPECRSLKPGITTIDANKVNIVFVGSGFDVAPSTWESEVQRVYNVFKNYNMFAEDNPQYNAYYVYPSEGLYASFCELGCQNISRLLCCEYKDLRRLANKCIRETATLQTIVVHNSLEYGGAGVRYGNLATTTINSAAPLVAVHELGHSLFELGDEYKGGFSTPSSGANCDSSGCSRWSDLIGNTPAGYDEVACVPACRGDMYYAPQQSFMYNVDYSVGAVNERFSCCTFLALTGVAPAYCDKFESSPGYLLDYCKNDYQGYGEGAYPGDGSRLVPFGESVKYVAISSLSTLVEITLHHDDSSSIVDIDPTPLDPGMHRKHLVEGDFASVEEAASMGVEGLVTVSIFSSSFTASPRILYFDPRVGVHAPLLASTEQTNGDNGNGNEQKARIPRSFFELVVPVNPAEIDSIVVERKP